jgi:hypothetical protein
MFFPWNQSHETWRNPQKSIMLGIETLKKNIIRMELNAETNMWWCEDYDWLCPANGHMGLSFWWMVILGI